PVETLGGPTFYCQFQVHGFGTGNPKSVSGEDRIGALQNALAALDAEVCIIGCNFKLRREGQVSEDTGFREMPSLRAMWEAWFISSDYEKAVSLARPLAETGVAFAQKVLGLAKLL